MGGVGHWPLDVIKRFVPIVMDATGCLVEGTPWKRSQTGLSKSHLKTYFSGLTELLPQVQCSGSTYHESSAIQES